VSVLSYGIVVFLRICLFDVSFPFVGMKMILMILLSCVCVCVQVFFWFVFFIYFFFNSLLLWYDVLWILHWLTVSSNMIFLSPHVLFFTCVFSFTFLCTLSWIYQYAMDDNQVILITQYKQCCHFRMFVFTMRLSCCFIYISLFMYWDVKSVQAISQFDLQF
jgi:hypothetical protein